MKSSKFKKKYKAIIFDVDGTLIPNKEDGMPSENVKKAILKASKKIKISIATSRSLPHAIHIIDSLSINSPVILNGGTMIWDPRKKSIIWEKNISNKKYREIVSILKDEKIKAFANRGNDDIEIEKLPASYIPQQIWIGKITKRKAEKLRSRLEAVKMIIPHFVPSWTNGLVDVIITHSEATKLHGILEISKFLKVKSENIIGVGDGYNDFPLLMACGLKIAMGNAVPDLKAIADYVAPSVDDDGVADVIEKFVL